MNEETDTPETNAAECDCSEFYDIGVMPDESSGPSGYVPINVSRKLERERDEARHNEATLIETISQTLALLDKGNPIDRPCLLAEIIRKRHPKL